MRMQSQVTYQMFRLSAPFGKSKIFFAQNELDMIRLAMKKGMCYEDINRIVPMSGTYIKDKNRKYKRIPGT